MKIHVVMMMCILIIAIVMGFSLSERTVKIYGNETVGYYYIDVYLGDDSQRATLIIDTGSSLTTLPCNGSLILNGQDAYRAEATI